MIVKRLLCSICLLLLFGAAESAFAQDPTASYPITSYSGSTLEPSTTRGPYYYYSENELRTRKFFRGAGNVVLCVAEVPNQMFLEAYRTSPVTGIVVGAGKGVVRGGKRFMIGWLEMFTFYHPGKNHYQPIIQPEVVFMDYIH